MSKMNLKSSFKAFCEQNKFEVNTQQIEIIDLLDKFINQKILFLWIKLKLYQYELEQLVDIFPYLVHRYSSYPKLSI